MPLKPNVYSAFEGIVGQENISQEPAILDSYAFQMGTKAVAYRIWMERPEAVLLPASTEEVQRIVKTCNRYGVKFKALGSGFCTVANVTRPGRIILDMRRMNRIVEINEKDCYAVVEPYVSWVQLQAETMKHGLNCNTIEAGGQCNIMASCTSGWGMGLKSIAMGHNERNNLAVEWVLPTGEVLRLGSLGSGAGYFCGDGPGPSLRGIMRGFIGAWGGLGVFTKVAIKLYHWPGPPDFFKLSGVSPVYDAEIPDKTFKNYYCFFSDWDSFADAAIKIGEAEIAEEFGKANAAIITLQVSRSNQEYSQIYRLQKSQIKGPGFQVIIAAESDREFDNKEKTLKKILADYNGKVLPVVTHELMQKRIISQCVKVSTINRSLFRPSGAYSSTMGSMDTWDLGCAEARKGAEIKKKFVDQGLLFDDGIENGWGLMYEQGHFGHLEMLNCYDPADQPSCRAMTANADEANRAMLECAMGIPFGGGGDRMHDLYGPATMNYPRWLEAIKTTIDPKCSADPNAYIRPRGPDGKAIVS